MTFHSSPWEHPEAKKVGNGRVEPASELGHLDALAGVRDASRPTANMVVVSFPVPSMVRMAGRPKGDTKKMLAASHGWCSR